VFQRAYEIAAEFTIPVVLSRRTVSGACSSSIGAAVVINEDGWFVTAHHIVEQFGKLAAGEEAHKNREVQEAAIRNDGTLDRKAKSKALAKLGKPRADDTARASGWWGRDGLGVKGGQFVSLPAVDVAVAQFENFDPASVKGFPKFKDPSKAFEPGEALCKLGFPFHSITPTWDDAKQAFGFTGLIPRFPIDGILTRMVQVQVNGTPPQYPLKWIETSTPGLRGQSGGPIFDVQGTIWGLQVRTAHHPLGFAKPGQPEQYLNVGLGVHTETLFGLFDECGIKYEVSTY